MREKPSAPSMSKPGASRSAAVKPSVSVQKASPRFHLLKAKRISKALARAFSIDSMAESGKPLSRSAS
ncbi:hypothetical protein D3C83_208920 [compost metagenome]